jgi:CBS domain containing-hemolysin-like protein
LNIMAYLGIVLDPVYAERLSIAVGFAIISFLHIVIGELAPKSIAIQKSEKVTLFIALPMRIFYVIFKPIIFILNGVASKMLHLMGFEAVGEDHTHTSDELRILIKESSESGLIDDSEHKLIENVFEFKQTPIKQIMIPRNKIVGIELHISREEMIDFIIDEGYSRLPVFDKTIDNILGVIYAKDVLASIRYPNLFVLEDLVRPAFYVNEEDKIKDVLNELKKQKMHFAIVSDEFGGTSGLVTLEDIIEEVFGEIQDEYDDENPIVEKISENEYIVLATATIGDVNEILPFPLPEDEDYETVGGLINNTAGKLPEKNELINLDNYECYILERSDRMIEKVKLVFNPMEESDDADED